MAESASAPYYFHLLRGEQYMFKEAEMTKVIRETESQPVISSKTSAKPRSRWARRFFFLMLCAGLLLFFLPQIASWVCRSPSAVAWVSGQPAGTIGIGNVEFTWQGPVKLTDVVLQSSSGRPLASVASMTSERTFWDLLTQRFQPMKLKLDGVKFSVEVSDPEPSTEGTLDLSQLIDSIQDFDVPTPPTPMEIEITNASVDFFNPQQMLLDRWENISGQYQYSTEKQVSQNAAFTIPAAPARGTGELVVQAEWLRESDADQSETFAMAGAGDQISFAAADAWLRKYLGDNHGLANCSGTLKGTFHRDRNQGWRLAGAVSLADTATLFPEQAELPDPANQQATTLEIQSEYSRTTDEFTVSQLNLVADEAAVNLRGVVKEVTGEQVLDVLAEVRTPGDALLDLLPLEIRENIRVQGMKFSEISITGALFPSPDGTSEPLTYSVIAAWDIAQAYGLESSGGQMRVSYRDGQIVSEPLHVPVNGGKLLTLPVVDLRSGEAILHFREGTMLENVRLTEAICRDWLMYISPTLANATSADGRLTLALNEGQMPIQHLEQADLGGVLAIREGSVRPGPLAVEVLIQVSQVQALLNRGGDDLTQRAFLTMSQENVGFRLYQGRVYHENFGANIGEVRIATAGSMGLDQTLAMQLNIGFPQKWLAEDRPVLAALASEPIPLGITGTLDEPVIDASAMADFGKQIGIKAGVGILEKLLERRQQRGK